MARANTLYFVDIVGELGIIKLSRRATIPVREDGGGYNIFSVRDHTIQAGAAEIASTGLLVSSFFFNIKHYI